MSDPQKIAQTCPDTGPAFDPLQEERAQLVQAVGMISHCLDRLASGIARNEQLLRRVLLSQSTYLGDGTALTYDDHLWKLFVDTRSYDIGTHALMGGHWEDEYRLVFEKLVRPGDVVFDVGANIGFYTLCAARQTGPNGQVHAFEPNPRLAGLLVKSVKVNGCAQLATVHKLALSNRDGDAPLYIQDGETGGANLHATSQAADGMVTVQCQTRCADHLFPDDFRVDVIKMDVEGFEGCVFDGMRAMLQRSRNVRIMMEWYPPMLDASPMSATQTASMLREFGFMAWECLPDLTLAATTWEALLGPGQKLRNIVVARSDPLNAPN